MSDIKITKSTKEVYYLRTDEYFADISIDEDDSGKGGSLSIAADYGNSHHYWGACGMPFKQFLCKIGIDYVAGKFSLGKEIDEKATILQWKKDVIKSMRDGDIDMQETRAIWDSIKELDGTVGSVGESYFMAELSHHAELLRYYYHHPPIITGITDNFKDFWERLWLPFLEHLKQEIQQEINHA